MVQRTWDLVDDNVAAGTLKVSFAILLLLLLLLLAHRDAQGSSCTASSFNGWGSCTSSKPSFSRPRPGLMGDG
jgi:hypothetical protein